MWEDVKKGSSEDSDKRGGLETEGVKEQEKDWKMLTKEMGGRRRRNGNRQKKQVNTQPRR